MDSLLSQDIKKKSVYSIISELKRLPTIPPLETVHSLISVDENSSTSLLKLFCVSAWILNKNKIKPIPNNWLSLLDLLLLKAEEFANSKAIHIHLESNFTEKDQGTLNKVSLKM